uniref:Uncharacterized protein n=1 Tax=Varanus komodoensis TaxID=61221 RepID=A0A8D2L5N8_VARKO
SFLKQVLVQQLGGHGGLCGALWQLSGINDLIVDIDKYCNKYCADEIGFLGYRGVIYAEEMNGEMPQTFIWQNPKFSLSEWAPPSIPSK